MVVVEVGVVVGVVVVGVVLVVGDVVGVVILQVPNSPSRWALVTFAIATAVRVHTAWSSAVKNT